VQEVNLLRRRVEGVLRLRWLSARLKRSGEAAVGVQLQGTSTGWEAVIRQVQSQAEALQLDTVHVDVNAPHLQEGYFVHWTRPGGAVAEGDAWCRMHLPLRVEGRAVGSVRVTAADHGHNRVEVVMAVLGFVDGLSELTEGVLSGPTAAKKSATLAVQPA